MPTGDMWGPGPGEYQVPVALMRELARGRRRRTLRRIIAVLLWAITAAALLAVLVLYTAAGAGKY